MINAAKIDIGGANIAGLPEIARTYTQTTDGLINIDIGGINNTAFDLLEASNAATLAGALRVQLIQGFVPSVDQSFLIMIFASRTGEFDTITGPDLGLALLRPPTRCQA